MKTLSTTPPVQSWRVWPRAIALAVVVSATSGCTCFWCPSPPDDTRRPVSEVFWRAFSEPETFDAWLATRKVESGAASCLRSRSDRFWSDYQNKLRECGQLISGSSLWDACHDEADGMSNGSVVARDLAQALEGSTRFDATSAGQYPIGTKRMLGPEQWGELIAAIREAIPEIEC